VDSFDSIWAALSNMSTSLIAAAIALAVDVVFQRLFRYTFPNIGYYKRSDGRDITFFIRNLDSVEYTRKLIVTVSGRELAYVTVEAGPWCDAVELDAHDTVKVTFTTVPEDGVFIIRARAAGDVRLGGHKDSELQVRDEWKAELKPFTFRTILKYYAPRYVLGLAVFGFVFIGSIYIRGGTPDVGDWTLAVLGMLVSILAFLLVVPYKGKRTVGGYESGMSVGKCWPSQQKVIELLDERILGPGAAPLDLSGEVERLRQENAQLREQIGTASPPPFAD
jgi:hypothetical protein